MKFGPRSWLVGALVLLPPLAVEALLGHGPHKGFDVFGFYAWFGFGACLLMVLAALLVGRVLKRRDDYYDD